VAASEQAARVCVVGSITVDLVVDAPRFPAPGETLMGGSSAEFPGGKGANQTAAAARMGAAVSLVGAVGDDAHGRLVMHAVEAEGVAAGLVSRRSGAPTGVGLITVSRESGENMIVVASGANLTLTEADVEAARGPIRDADVLVLQLEVPLAAVVRAAAIARDVGTKVILNAAPIPDGGVPAELLALADVLVVNRGEAERVAAGRIWMGGCPVSRSVVDEDACGALPENEPGFAELLMRLASLGVQTVVMTLGAQGSACIRERQCVMVPAFPVEAVDTVGAGDAFVGTLAVRWAEQQAAGHTGGMAVFDALCWASAAGALAATKRGAMPSMPTRAEVRALLARR
jgi:ribokinase